MDVISNVLTCISIMLNLQNLNIVLFSTLANNLEKIHYPPGVYPYC